jgi:cysteine synthase B
VEPDTAFHGLEGLKHMPSALVPDVFEPALVNETARVATEEAQAMTRRLAREQGLLLGVSSGAAVLAATRLAPRLGARNTVVICPDGGERYLSERFWEVRG